jgi:hypothetical protein
MTLLAEIEVETMPWIAKRQAKWLSMVESPFFSKVYCSLLVNSYFYIRESVPLMSDALVRLREQDYDHRLILSFLETHILEEQGHDLWVLEDLSVLGRSPDTVRAGTPLSSVVQLVGTQYYLQSAFSPLAIFGYMTVLECTPPNPHFLVSLSKRHDIPISAMSTFMRHAEHDIEHRDELAVALDQLRLGAAERRTILLSARSAAHSLFVFFAQLEEQIRRWDAPALLRA